MTLPGWTREPLVHFLALGAVLYVVLTWGGTPVDPSSRVIAVDGARKAQLALAFEQVMGRAPTDAELDARIERYVREEVLYREALRLGLDADDAVVRQRMVAKMDMTASAAAEIAEPDEATLRAFFKANQARYAGTRAVSFEQRLFGDEQAARAGLADPGAAARSASLPPQMTEAPQREVEARFGQQFAQGLAGIAADGQWHGPIPSGFGWHIVRVTGRDSSEPDFEALRPRIANDWRSAQIATREERAYAILRSAYRVDIDK
ncbi:MAG: peptidylprolyl isomerase [Porphyrobacter sp.]|nr:peptidylprolyl isomerase [Porphyrobacter sp.]